MKHKIPILGVSLALLVAITIGVLIDCSSPNLPTPEPTPVSNHYGDYYERANLEEINLSEALLNDSRGIMQRFMNGWGFPKIVASSGGAPVPSISWPDRRTIVYEYPTQMAGQQYLRMTLSGITVKDFGEINWGTEKVQKNDTVSNIITTINIPKDTKFKRTFTYHFSAVETLEQSTSTEFETEAKTKFGPEYAGFDFSAKVKTEATKKFGTEKTYATDDTQEFEFEGPRHIQIEAIRARQQVSRDVSSQPILDYQICLETRYEAVHHVCWDNKEQLISYMKGLEPDSVGVLYWDATPISNAGSQATAGIFRARPYKDYEIPNNTPPIAFPADYIEVLNQSIVAKDLNTGEILTGGESGYPDLTDALLQVDCRSELGGFLHGLGADCGACWGSDCP